MPHATADMEVATPQSDLTPSTSQANDDIELPDAPEPRTTTDKVALEDIFNDDVSDSELLTSTADVPSSPPLHNGTSTSSPTSSAPAVTTTVRTESYSDPTIMLQYYARLFPFRPLFLWLNASPSPSPRFANREFALTLSNDAYLRYQSYPSHDLLRKDILRLNPSRFEIGPEYSTNPRDRKTLRKASTFRPLTKEMVFDIDLTDYDDIRTCCVKANICEKCWKFATMTIKVLDAGLREDFGFEHILWVYSGRRGVHAWISDKEARELDDDKRRALVGYFEVLKGGAQGGKKVNLKRPLHPHVRRSLDILQPYFFEILVEQEPFMRKEGEERLLQLLPDRDLNDALRKKWASSPDRPSRKKWEDIDELAKTGVSKSLDTKALLEAKQDIRLEYTYPRIDVEVGKKRIHLLKSPFVVHPGTGRVCVPITCGGDMKKAEQFDPLTVPKVTELLKEIDTFRTEYLENEEDDGTIPENAKSMKDWEKTRLRPYYNVFNDYVTKLVKSENMSLKREREEDGHSGANGMDF
ncbi:p48 polypeptide of DNA primase [Knufia obscura]|uniref:DNA primase n=2 Tax=Knufia TaxID=430999 RepID=A0AAN8ES27_9EURO|nr:p48 polypeptide of DNA primase [Knufia obscura]KAK5957623.1 p48 polypeptide of DNA primase [Knufia fluminis]